MTDVLPQNVGELLIVLCDFRGPSSVMSMGACVPLWYAAMSPIEPTLLTGLKEFLHLRPHLPTHYNTQNSHDSLQSNNKHTHTTHAQTNLVGCT